MITIKEERVSGVSLLFSSLRSDVQRYFRGMCLDPENLQICRRERDSLYRFHKYMLSHICGWDSDCYDQGVYDSSMRYLVNALRV